MKRAKTKAPQSDAMAEYHLVAETVGGMPSLRVKDNLYQTIAIAISVVIGAGVGALIANVWWVGALFGTLIALVVSVFISGTVLMVLGWVRAAQFKRSKPK